MNKKIVLSEIKHIHFIGVGGIGMSALARFFLREKTQVSGSDRSDSLITDALTKEGVVFFNTQTAANISSDIDLVVYTEAMHHDQEEMVAAKALGVPMVNYFEALGMVANEYYLIAVSGTHGKTTTTAMLTDILEEAGLDPTAIIGSLRSKTGSNFRAGKSKYAVVEACEYRRDFLHLKPDVLVITNLELEHVDYYKDLADVQDAFHTLATAVPEDGFIVTNTSDVNIAPVLKGVLAKVIDYRTEINLELALRQPGLHNRLNAAAAKAAALTLGIDSNEINSALENFAGTWRRFEYKGDFVNESGKVPVYDDYAHHPTEIEATISGARELYPNHPLTVVFQSHTYTRTHELFADFVKALAKADKVILLPIYAAREENISGVTSEKLAEALEAVGAKVVCFMTAGAAVQEVTKNTPKDGVVVVMGAGDVTQIATILTK
jgi:UDP-N-acetylmuramate--alanine ligase